jgi:PAS domain S-box-containing protein
MNYQLSAISYLFFISTILTLSFGFWLLSRRYGSAATYLAIGQIIVAFWTFAGGMEVTSLSLDLKIFWSKVSYLGIATAPLSYFLFTLEYAQLGKWINLRKVITLLILPLIVIVAAFTNNEHHLFWPAVHLTTDGKFAIYSQGPVFWLNVTYQYGLLIVGLIVLVMSLHRMSAFYRPQIIIFIGASTLPHIANIMYVFRLLPMQGLDITPLAFILMWIIIGFGIVRYRVFDLVPLARKQILETIPDPVIVLDHEDRIIDMNPALEEITGRKNKAIIGIAINEVLPWLRSYISKNEREKEQSLETSILINGIAKHYDIKSRLIHNSQGAFKGRILVFRDITKRKDAEDLLLSANEKLKKEIFNKERAISDLDAFSRTVAHDLKNPIYSLITAGELLEQGMVATYPEGLELAKIIGESGFRMARIVDELLLLASVGKANIEKKTLDMQIILLEVRNRLQRMLSEYNAIIIEPEEWISSYGHQAWIEEVWVNYLSNAIKYGGNPPILTLRAERVEIGYVRYSVQDNGNGLSNDKMATMFREFLRYSSLNIEGHGLGLSIVKRIIDKLDGKVSATSENLPGKGCIFSFSLPDALL